MSLVAHWRLDGDASDSVGGYDGYEVGGPTYSSGKLGDCYDNTGNNAEGIELIRHNDFTEYENYYSFSLWFKSTETASGYGNERIISRDASEYPTLTIDQTQSGNQGLNLYRTSMAEGSVSVNEWHHVVFTIDVGSNSSQLYIDGDLRDTGDVSPTTLARPFVIGGNTEGDGDVSSGNFIGKIDDVRLYDHVLSAKEVQKLSQAKVLHYKFDQFAEPTDNVFPEALREMSSNSGWDENYHPEYTATFEGQIGSRDNVYKLVHDGTNSGDWYSRYNNLSSTSVGEEYVFSREYKVTQGTDKPNNAILYQDGWKGGGNADKTVLFDKAIGNGWRRRSVKFTINTAGSPVLRMSTGYTSNSWTVYMDNFQYEKKDHATPFVNGTRGGVVTDVSGQGNDAHLEQKYIDGIRISAPDSLTFYENQWNGSGNTGEADVSGSEFTDSLGIVRDITPVDNGIAGSDSQTHECYIMYSEEDIFDRFSGHNSSNCHHLTFVNYVNGEWQYDDNGGFDSNNTFTPRGTDTLLAEVDRNSGSIDSINKFSNNKIPKTPTHTESSKVGSGAYEFDGSNDSIDIPPNGIPTGNEVTVSFWSYGGVDQPTDNSILEAEDSGNNRVLNIHHPWGNGNIYWDTDNGGSGTDRIYKSANSSDYKGRWAHWTFTKDANTGDQKIYLDGQLWHSGTGKTGSLATTDVASLGSYADGTTDYWQGKVDDFRIYATALSASEVKEIYEQRASIDSGGNFHGHELSEIVETGLELEAYSRGNNS